MPESESRPQIKTLSTTITQTIESPYPPSAEVEAYERILPGAAERIVSLVEIESQHRRELEKTALKQESRDSLIGLIFAFVVAMTTTVGGGLLIYCDHAVAGSVLGVSGVASIVGAFLRSRPSSPTQNNESDNTTDH